MAEEHSIKNLVARAASDPWNVVLGRRPGSYQIPEVGHELMATIDYAVFERNHEKAIVTGVIFEKWAESTPHFSCKASAVMSTVYSIGGILTVAEEKIHQAKTRIGNCTDCRAHYLKRNAIFSIYEERPQESLLSYTEAISLFTELGDTLEQAKCLIGRGVVKSMMMRDHEGGLSDQDAGMSLLDANAGHYLVYGVVNKAQTLTKLGRRDEAKEQIERAQEYLAGIKSVERPKLLLRWIRAQLLEADGDRKDQKLAGQMLDRVESRMRHLNMEREIRIVLADRALVARAPHTIRQIAQKALAMETSRRVRERIQAVIDDTSRENILKWRQALDSYVPPFVESA